MPQGKDDQVGSMWKIGPQWILFAMVLGVLILSIMAFMRPVFQPLAEITPPATQILATDENDQGPRESQTPQEAFDELPPTPEEIGFTDGIILFSTILVLILLIGTLRETMYRKSR